MNCKSERHPRRLRWEMRAYRLTVGIQVMMISLAVLCGAPVTGQPLTVGNIRIAGHGLFDIQGQYGTIPTQTTAIERDYEWWVPGKVGFWEYHLEAGVRATFREHITTRLTLTTRGGYADRDFALWGNEVAVNARLKEASIRLDRLWSSRLALEGGRQRIDYPLLTAYDYVGGRLIFRPGSWITIDWGQWQVFEGRTVDRPGESSDDIDLWGPGVRFDAPRIRGHLYALINSKAGGSDGIGNNIKILGIASDVYWMQQLTVGGAGIIQHGETSVPVIGQRDVRAWAFRGCVRYHPAGPIAISGEYWAGSGDDIGTPGVDEAFQQFGYRNTLEKSSLFYRPSLTDLRLIRGRIQAVLARFTGRVALVRISEGTTGRGLGTEIGMAVEYAYSDHARLRWQWGTTTDGHRMQMFELSSGFGWE